MSNLVDSITNAVCQLLCLFVMSLSFLDSLLLKHNLLSNVLLSSRNHCQRIFIESLLRNPHSILVDQLGGGRSQGFIHIVSLWIYFLRMLDPYVFIFNSFTVHHVQVWLIRTLACCVLSTRLSTTLRVIVSCVGYISYSSWSNLLSTQASILYDSSCKTSSTFGLFLLKHLGQLLSWKWRQSLDCWLCFAWTSWTSTALGLLCCVQWFYILAYESEMSGRISLLNTSMLVSKVDCVILLDLVCCRLLHLRALIRLILVAVTESSEYICLSKLLSGLTRLLGCRSGRRSCTGFHHSSIILTDQLID